MTTQARAPEIILYEISHTRSARCRWALDELGLDYTSISRPDLIHSEELTRVHPLGKLPAAVIDGRALFESAAICTYLADLAPDKGLLCPSGTYERAVHDQWVCFCLTEMEAYLWSTARNTMSRILPEEEQVREIVPQNNEMFARAAAVPENLLGDADYLVGGKFSMTDVIVGFTVNWAAITGRLEGFPNLQAYLARLRARPHCPLSG